MLYPIFGSKIGISEVSLIYEGCRFKSSSESLLIMNVEKDILKQGTAAEGEDGSRGEVSWLPRRVCRGVSSCTLEGGCVRVQDAGVQIGDVVCKSCRSCKGVSSGEENNDDESIFAVVTFYLEG